ncbi:MAG: NH(3)-dependent NAD(+) synthetase [Promethearchaeota archaeon]|nr:MAG: NH(3)-dependent NAD(+) synthetase [Candidatus Lokiarchaeota archaeon]
MRSLSISELKGDIQQWINMVLTTAKADGVIIGLSGGIDSAVTASLCVNSLGKESVLGVSLPCQSNREDIKDARLIAEKLEITFIIMDVSSVFEMFEKTIIKKIEKSPLNSKLTEVNTWRDNVLALANIKPRLRMTTLYYIGQSLGLYLVAGTGNRTEIAIGYFTKYGDGGVDFEPIGDLYKCEVRALAKELEVPKKIIERAPSAGLWKGQTDEGEIGMTYDEMDEIIYRIDYNLDLSDLNKENVKKVRYMMQSSSHKKKMPPIFKVS